MILLLQPIVIMVWHYQKELVRMPVWLNYMGRRQVLPKERVEACIFLACRKGFLEETESLVRKLGPVLVLLSRKNTGVLTMFVLLSLAMVLRVREYCTKYLIWLCCGNFLWYS